VHIGLKVYSLVLELVRYELAAQKRLGHEGVTVTRPVGLTEYQLKWHMP
jgi:hypothetical protein